MKHDEEKDRYLHDRTASEKKGKTIWINFLCLLLGIGVFVLGVMAPQTIFAMIDKTEIGSLYVRDADTSYLDEQEQLSMSEKIQLLCDRFNENKISVSSTEKTVEVEDEAIIKAAAEEIVKMQQKHVLPELEFDVKNTQPNNIVYTSFLNLWNMNQYVMLAQLVYQVSSDYLYITMDVETGTIMEYVVYASVSNEEYLELLQCNVQADMVERLGITNKEVLSCYQYTFFDETSEESYSMNSEGKVCSDELYEAINQRMDSDVGSENFIQIGMQTKE